jgi:DNA-directed RNA polymerase subunit N (RpoN/RPB10)
MQMNIRCLSCGHTIDLDDDYSDYEGQIKCYTCNALLEVKLSDGLVRSENLYWQTVRCLSCGHRIGLDEAYRDYEGQIKCYKCNSLLEVRLSNSLVRSVNLYMQAAADLQEQDEHKLVHPHHKKQDKTGADAKI